MKQLKNLNLENRTLDQVKELLCTSRLVESRYMDAFTKTKLEKFRKAAQNELRIQLTCEEEITKRQNAEKDQIMGR